MPTLPQAYKHLTSRAAAPGPLPKPKVLVIDDDRSIRELLRLHLQNGGYEALVAEDAVVGGRLVLDTAPDLIIVDVNMPYLDGPDFVAALRSDPKTNAIPVVFLAVEEDLADRTRHLGAVAYLKKPVMADRLLALVELFVAVPRAA